jgi:hypothetical protein
LRLLGLDRSQTVLRLPSHSGGVWGQLFAQVVLQSAWLFRDLFHHERLSSVDTALWVTFIVLLCLGTYFALHGETVIGTDGVLFLRPLRRTFVPFAEIQSVDRDVHAPTKLVVRTRAGKTFKRTMPAPVARAARVGDAFPWGRYVASVVRIVAPQGRVLGPVGWVEIRLSDPKPEAGREAP